MMDGIAASGELDAYPYLHAARADLLRRLERWSEAATAYAARSSSRNGPNALPRSRLPRSAEAARPDLDRDRAAGDAGEGGAEHRSERTRRCASEERRRQRTPAPSSGRRPYASTSGTSTTCSAMNQTCSSWRRRTSPISRSFEPKSCSSRSCRSRRGPSR